MDYELDSSTWTTLFERNLNSNHGYATVDKLMAGFVDTAFNNSTEFRLLDDVELETQTTQVVRVNDGDFMIKEYSTSISNERSVVSCHGDIFNNRTIIEDRLLFSAGLDVANDLVKLYAPEKEYSHDQEQTIHSLLPVELGLNIENRLLRIYFDTVHNFCPIIRQLDFYKWYGTRDASWEDTSLDSLVYHAMKFAAFQHLSDGEVRQTPFSSLMEGQKALFDYTHLLYQSLEKENEGEVQLVQAALLLSNWSPFDSSKEVTSFWVDKAFHHAHLKEINKGRTSFHRVLWWCCIVRNRTIALGLRSPRRLRKYKPSPLLQISDFGILGNISEKGFHESTKFSASFFIYYCRLSDVFQKIVLLGYQEDRWDSWKIEESHVISSKALQELQLIDQILESLIKEIDTAIAKWDTGLLSSGFTISLQVLRIIALSAKVSLYERCLRFLHIYGAFSPPRYSAVVAKMKKAALATAAQARHLSATKIEDIPLQVTAWIALPMAVHCACIDREEKIYSFYELRTFGSLKLILREMNLRSKGAQHVSNLLESVDKSVDFLRHGEMREEGKEIIETKLLIHASRMMDSSLGRGCKL